MPAQVIAALHPIIDQLFAQARIEGRHESRDAYAFDALVQLADPPATPSNGSKVKYLGLLRVDLDALVRGEVAGEECCELTGLGPIPVRVARAMLGESILKLLITRGQAVASGVHLGRGPIAGQKIALLWTQPTCSRLGCDQPWAHAEVDHRIPWADTHHTVLDGLAVSAGTTTG